MSVYGGLEYTEAKAGPGATFLHSYPGTGAPGAPVPRDETMTIGAEQIGFYHVAPADLAGLAGARRDTGDVLRDGRVRLTADTITAEWVIEGHGQAGLTVDAMMANMRQDIAGLIGLRRQRCAVGSSTCGASSRAITSSWRHPRPPTCGRLAFPGACSSTARARTSPARRRSRSSTRTSRPSPGSTS